MFTPVFILQNCSLNALTCDHKLPPFGYSRLSIISKISSGEDLKNTLSLFTFDNLPYYLLNLVLKTLKNKHRIFFTIKAHCTMYTMSVSLMHTTKAGLVSVDRYLLKYCLRANR
jgi:hypothetical protein